MLRAPLNMFIGDVLREYLIANHGEMVCAILDAEGTAHKDVWVDENARAPTADELVRGLQTVRHGFPPRELLLYYGLQALTSTEGHWAALGDACERPEFDELLKAALSSCPHLKPKDEALDLLI
jgi:hypothetical protein